MPVRILTFTTLYPNAAQPQHGVFVENRLRQLLTSGKVSARVIAPVPWFPFSGAAFGKYGAFARTPRVEERNGIRLYHPRFPVIPKIGMGIAPELIFRATRHIVERLIDDGGDFDLIDSHYFYPDGVAATMLGAHFGKPVVITARGTDVNLFPDFPTPRRKILIAANAAAGIVTVAQSLKDRLIALGVDEAKIQVLRNGVNLELFRPVEESEFRSIVSPGRRVVVSVGNLIPLKGHDLVIRVLVEKQDLDLVIVGQGPEYAKLRKLSHSLGVADRVHFLGSVPHEKMPEVYAMADVLVLASSREGWANVLLEAMACGTPVAATNVSGTPEIVTAPEAGVLIDDRSVRGIAAALTRLFDNLPDRARTRAHAEKFSWKETTDGQLALFDRILSSGRR